jgi:ZIP family zinc transporter
MSFLNGLSLGQLLWLRLILAVGMASLGAIIASRAKKIDHHGLCLLISFAAGALLAVALFDILPEAAAMSGLVPALVSALTGYLLFWGITKFVFHVCPACAATHTEVNFKAITLAMVVALSVHSFMDGLAIYAGLKAGSSLGVLILFAVAYHKLPEGMALTLVAIGSGRKRAESFLLTVGLEASTTIGGGLAGLVSALPAESPWIGLLLGHVAGGFVYLVGHALLSEVVKDHPRSTLLAAFVGGASMALVTAFLGTH